MKKLFLAIAILAVTKPLLAAPDFLGDKDLVAFYTNENISDVTATIPYPGLKNSVIVEGIEQNRVVQDCIAFVYSAEKVYADQILWLADDIEVTEGAGGPSQVLTPTVQNGTVLYRVPAGSSYQTDIRVRTLDGKTFTETKKRILGDKATNLRLQYRRACHDVQ
jgi:hypothetical protein